MICILDQMYLDIVGIDVVTTGHSWVVWERHSGEIDWKNRI